MSTFSTKVSASEMEEQSKKATAEGMRQIAEAMASAAFKKKDECSDSDNSLDSDSDSDGLRSKRKRKTKVVHNDSAIVEKLENRVRFLQLDLTNALVSVEDSKRSFEELSLKLTPYRRANDELAFLKSAMMRAFKDTNSMNLSQLNLRLKIFHDEATEHAALCNAAISKIDLDEIKHSLQRILVAEKKRLILLESNFKDLIFWARAKEFVIYLGTWLSVLIVLFAVLYQLF